MGKLLESLISYFENTPKEQLERDFQEIEEYCQIGPNADDFIKWTEENMKHLNDAKNIG